MRMNVWSALAVSSFIVVFIIFQGCGQPQTSGKTSQGKVETSQQAQNSSETTQKESQPIQIKGSDTMVNLGKAWAESFMVKYPEANLAVTGGGSGTGIASLIQGTAQVVQSSRAIEPVEIMEAQKNGITPKEFLVGYDGIAVIVNPGNTVQSLTIQQLADIFTGKITNWNMVGGNDGKVVILSREVNSGTHVYFKEHVLNGGNTKGTVEFAPDALMMSSSQAIVDEVASNPNAVGYIGMGYISVNVKVVPIAKDSSANPVTPNVENVKSNSYPISRPLYIYTKGEPEGMVKQFVDFVLSSEGQEIVKKDGFVPFQ